MQEQIPEKMKKDGAGFLYRRRDRPEEGTEAAGS